MAGIWDFLNREFSPGVSWANKAADMGGTIVKGILDSTIDAVKVPGQMMKPNPYPPGSEEAYWWDTQKYKKATEWGPEMALNTIGTGGIMGVPVKGAETVLGSGILRPKKGVGGYHGTVAPENFSKFKESDVDLGTHFAVDPDVSAKYALNSTVDGLERLTEGAKTIPVVADIKKPLLYPTDPINWREPEWVMQGIKDQLVGEDFPYKAPRGLLADMIRADKDAGGWEKNFIPMLKDRGYDSINYPHSTSLHAPVEFNSYMALDANQVIPRFSPEGQSFIKERGIIEPPKRLRDLDDIEYWFTQPEHEKWANPPSGPKPSSAPSVKVGGPKGTSLTWNPYESGEKSAVEGLLKKLKAGDIDKEEYLKLHGKIFGLE